MQGLTWRQSASKTTARTQFGQQHLPLTANLNCQPRGLSYPPRKQEQSMLVANGRAVFGPERNARMPLASSLAQLPTVAPARSHATATAEPHRHPSWKSMLSEIMGKISTMSALLMALICLFLWPHRAVLVINALPPPVQLMSIPCARQSCLWKDRTEVQ